jgi:23S rRNA (pseudouridine1915-N3)-methyltransferase
MFKLICVGQKMPGWVTQGFEEYAKRLPAPYHLQLVEVPLRKRTKNADIVRLQREEGEQMLSHLSLQTHVVALDERGKLWNTEQLAQQLEVWQQNHAEIALLVGSPEGLAANCRTRAQQTWALSPLTLPHPLVRIVVAEQLYRAWSLLHHHPYHRV